MLRARLIKDAISVPPGGGAESPAPSAETEAILRRALQSDTATHRMLAARFGGTPGGGAFRRVAWLLARRPEWIRAEILPGDAMFLYDLVRLLRPSRAIEIGTASGFSGAFILAAMADSGVPLTDEAGRPALQTFDICERCAWNEEHAIGAALAEVVPRLAPGACFHRGKVAADAPGVLAGQTFPFAYIDASHRHPWPLADALMIAPLLTPGAWFCLNDIALVEVGLHHAIEHPGEDVSSWFARGPQLLFEHWPWPKIRGLGLCSNMGAVQVPDPAALTPAAFPDLLRYPWESNPSEAVKAILPARPDYRAGAAGLPDAM